MRRIKREPGMHKKALCALGAAVFAVCLFSAESGGRPFLFGEQTAMALLSPLQGGLTSAGNFVRDMTAKVEDISVVYEQNQALKQELEQLRHKRVEMQEIAAENERLRVLLDYKTRSAQFDLVTAQVVARDPSNWSESVLIGCGGDGGVQKDMAVVTAEGLVGSVTAVAGGTAKVQLLLDPHSSVGVLVQRAESRVAGIVEGNLAQKSVVRMVNIPRDADVVEGDQIVTSGFGGVYPKGIAVGVVKKIVNEPGGLLKYAELEPAVDFQRLEEVAVIVRSRESAPLPLTPPAQPQQSAEGRK